MAPRKKTVEAPALKGAREIIMRDPRILKETKGNPRTHSDEQIRQIRAAIDELGFNNPIALKDDEETVGAGHGRRLAALLDPPLAEVPTVVLRGLTDSQWRAFIIADNKIAQGSAWDMDLLTYHLDQLQSDGFNLLLTGFDANELGELHIAGFESDSDPEGEPKGNLAERFGIAPFSVLNAREGWWQNRKRAWLSLGIKSEVGRGENLLKMSDTVLEPDPAKRAANGRKADARTFGQDLMRGEGRFKQSTSLKSGLVHNVSTDAYRDPGGDAGAAQASGTSIFDPVLCELSYRWFCPPGGRIVDPFAGGSVRGIVASKLGRDYFGIDLRREQVEANQTQAEAILTSAADPQPLWVEGDSADLAALNGGQGADFIFSCPPYLWLERYSNDARDLSTMTEASFLKAYSAIIRQSVAILRPDRFAAFVVGDVRDKRGRYVNFAGHTVELFEAAGANYYNEAILVTAAGSLAMRAGKQFEATRKLGRTHQTVLIFIKGDPVKATKAIGGCEFGDIEGADMGEEGDPI